VEEHREVAVGLRAGRQPHDVPTTRLGATFWILAIQFFVVQVIVASAWARPYSLSNSVISDLGNTGCGPYPAGSTNIVCSPWHALMNLSFVVLGVTMSGGAMLTARFFAPGWRRTTAIALFLIGGAGVTLVGLYPENESRLLHAAGAAANFVGASVALILYGAGIQKERARPLLKTFSIVAGMTGLAATGLLVADHDLGLGDGGIERFAAYPVSIWQIVAGVSLMRRPILANGGQ
jgi:hypothetical membrane protein